MPKLAPALLLVTILACDGGSTLAVDGGTDDAVPSGDAASVDGGSSACGDGVIDPAAGEACDSTVDTAACDSDCTLPVCGDGHANTAAGEACDKTQDTSTCDSDCTLPVCGDGHLNVAAGEACDDGNAVDDDGCRFDCTIGPSCEAPVSTGVSDMWSGVENLADEALITALHNLIDNHDSVGYDTAKQTLFGTGGIDVHDGQVECVYTGLLFSPSQLDDQDGGFNTEHSWPQDDFPSAESTAAKADMHHLFATERNVNSRRGNLPFGEVNCTQTYCNWEGYGCAVGPRIGGTERVFMVRPVTRGDIARAHFYFAVRYSASIPGYEEEALKRWNRCDPVDDAERARNDAIEAEQGNRNPFVDRPEFAEQIADF